LEWRAGETDYEARFTAALGVHSFQWSSQGRFDATGLAPTRFVDQRKGRGAQAANFRREGGSKPSITYSGAAAEHPLHAGSQDRLSWIVQLVAIARAKEVLTTDESITLFVSGARGDADMWIFHVVGDEPVETAAGRVDAVKLLRHPRRAYDLLVEAWFEASSERLPLRIRLTPTGAGQPLDMVWAADALAALEEVEGQRCAGLKSRAERPCRTH
jgi:hypothetical protein